ncbi:hypothetical protein [Oceanobacillus sp. FSL H7-0719]|uniref:hypothetical protein n=1 Tax=Oceanobacillus sp. FSL H7-0719 TaxID=2954507 RepID=UPI00324CB652
MTLMNVLSLDAQERQDFEAKIKEKITSRFNLAADFTRLQSNEVDFSVLANPDEVQSKANTLGKRFVVPVKTDEGLDGEVTYTELQEVELINIATKTKKSDLLEGLQKVASSSAEFKQLTEHLIAEGYTVKDEEKYVLQTKNYLLDKAGETQSQEQTILVLPVYQNEELIGEFAIDGSNQKPIVVMGNLRTFVHEEEGIVTIQAEGCSLRWTRCMADRLNCGTWNSCLITFGSCIAACCGCANPYLCIGCIACAIAVVGAAWSCRMCVVGASRPNECPVS